MMAKSSWNTPEHQERIKPWLEIWGRDISPESEAAASVAITQSDDAEGIVSVRECDHFWVDNSLGNHCADCGKANVWRNQNAE